MTSFFESKKLSVVEEERDRVRVRMQDFDPGSEDYNILLDRFERLTILQQSRAAGKVSPDTVAIVAANLIGILIIVGYEHGHVIASRGLSFLLRTKHG